MRVQPVVLDDRIGFETAFRQRWVQRFNSFQVDPMRGSPGLNAKAKESRPALVSRQSMRAFVDALDREGALRRIPQTIDREFEIAACLAETDDGPALQFDRVAGHSMPVIGNLLNSLSRFADALHVTPATLQGAIVAAIENPLEHRVISSAPCHELTIANPVLTDELPIPCFFEHESGLYISAGCIIAKDRVSGAMNLSIARLMPLGGNRAFIGIAPNHHLAVMARAAHARGESLHIAVTIGNHPAVMVAACLYLGLGEDELKVAGALMGEPLEAVRCLDSDLPVPAHCECVLEGTLDAGEAISEGPVSEYHGLYEDYGPGILATFSRLTRRRDAVFQVVLPGYHREHCLLGGIAIAAGLARAARSTIPALREVAVGIGGAGRLHAVVALHKPRPGDARKAMFAIWTAVNLIKRVIVVDDDVDPWDPIQVEWAMATRMKADRDLVVVPDARTDRSDPLEDGGVIAKLGIDATMRPGDRTDWTKARPPEQALRRARELLTASPLSPGSNDG
jgi:2,5-furandicarboxylate decarboxylase 1